MSDDIPKEPADSEKSPSNLAKKETATNAATSTETGGPKGPEPTRYGDWEKKGRCIDF